MTVADANKPAFLSVDARLLCFLILYLLSRMLSAKECNKVAWFAVCACAPSFLSFFFFTTGGFVSSARSLRSRLSGHGICLESLWKTWKSQAFGKIILVDTLIMESSKRKTGKFHFVQSRVSNLTETKNHSQTGISAEKEPELVFSKHA